MEEELFSLKFELEALSSQILRRESERWVHNFMFPETEKDHIDRYEFAKSYVSNKKTLDIACGSGYGSYILVNEGNAESVLGIDLDPQAVRYAEHRYKHENIQRIVGDATSFDFKEKFDCIVSFETIEHIPNYKDFLANLKQALSKNGELIISTPLSKITTNTPHNPYHVIEWALSDFKNLLNEYFDIEETFFQNMIYSFPEAENKKTVKRKIINRIMNIREPKINKTIVNDGINKKEHYNNFDNFISGYVICICKLKNE